MQGSTKNSPVCKSFEINYTPYPAPIMPGSRTTVKRNVNDETFGNSLSDISVAAFQKRINSDALIISGDGGEIHAHQVINEFCNVDSKCNAFNILFYLWF